VVSVADDVADTFEKLGLPSVIFKRNLLSSAPPDLRDKNFPADGPGFPPPHELIPLQSQFFSPLLFFLSQG